MEQALFVGISLYMLVINVIAFVAFATDKRYAQRGGRRIPERRLLFLAAAGGGLGAFLGMRICHHKTQKRRFKLWVPLLAVLQLLLFGCFVALNVYAADYYHADERAQAALASDDAVTVREQGSDYLFDGPGTEALLVFYPGAKVQTEAYAPLMREVAAGGVDCVLVDMPYYLAFFGLNRAGAYLGTEGYAHYYVGGHSLGGAMAGSFAAGHAEELDGLMLLASYATSDLSESGLAVLSAYGSEDGVLNRESYAKNYGHLPADTQELVIAGGNHAQFGDYGAQAGDGTAQISAEEQQALTAEAIAALAQ